MCYTHSKIKSWKTLSNKFQNLDDGWIIRKISLTEIASKKKNGELEKSRRHKRNLINHQILPHKEKSRFRCYPIKCYKPWQGFKALQLHTRSSRKGDQRVHPLAHFQGLPDFRDQSLTAKLEKVTARPPPPARRQNPEWSVAAEIRPRESNRMCIMTQMGLFSLRIRFNSPW